MMLEECLDIIWMLFCAILYVNKFKYMLKMVIIFNKTYFHNDKKASYKV